MNRMQSKTSIFLFYMALATTFAYPSYFASYQTQCQPDIGQTIMGANVSVSDNYYLGLYQNGAPVNSYYIGGTGYTIQVGSEDDSKSRWLVSSTIGKLTGETLSNRGGCSSIIQETAQVAATNTKSWAWTPPTTGSDTVKFVVSGAPGYVMVTQTVLEITAIPTPNPPADEDLSSPDFDLGAQILGQSGKIRFWNKKNNQTTPGSERTVTFEGIAELDTNGDKIKGSQSKNHELNTFANQAFTFSAPAQGNYPGTDLNTDYVTFTTTLTNNAEFQATVYFFTESGEFPLDGDMIQVDKHSMKLNIALSNWAFCDPCTSGANTQTGAAVQVSIKVQDPSNATDSLSLALAHSADIDNTTKPVQITDEGDVNRVIKFTFPKFQQTVVYDPIFTLKSSGGGGGGDNDDDDSGLKPGAVAAIVIGVVIVVSAVAFCVWRRNKRRSNEYASSAVNQEYSGYATME